jgi:hypothetical protein
MFDYSIYKIIKIKTSTFKFINYRLYAMGVSAFGGKPPA